MKEFDLDIIGLMCIPPFDQNPEGYFSISLEKNLEVFGNGAAVKSISIAPFKFKTKYVSEAQ